MRLIGGGAEPSVAVCFVVLVISLEPHHLAVALERQHVRRNAVEEPPIVADDDHTPRKLNSASSSARSVSTSRSLVGSSSSSTLLPAFSSLAR